MGSTSDWPTMQNAVEVLREFGVPHDAQVLSAHRMPDEMFAFAEAAAGRGLRAIIAGAGGAAHLPGMLAAKTTVPVLGVPVATFAIGDAGARNAALFAVAMLAAHDEALATALAEYRSRRHHDAATATLPTE
jgi:5-(carboxyamino)imidazole ribonucleotide mutase